MSHQNGCKCESCCSKSNECKNEQKSSCGTGCGCGSNCKCGCKGSACSEDFSEHLLHLADEAWTCLLKDKIKEKILATSGEHLDKLATIISNANHDKWHHKIAIMKAKHDFKDQIASNLCCGSDSCKK